MATFPRDLKPRFSSTPVLAGALMSMSESGKLQTRNMQRTGWQWTERFLFKWDDLNGQELLSWAQGFFNTGDQLDVVHQDLQLFGSGGGTPLVAGSDQTGSNISTDGWPTSTSNVLRSGDWVQFAGLDQVFRVLYDRDSDSGGNIDVYTIPHVFDSPGDNAAISTSASITFKAKITDIQVPAFGPDMMVDVSVTFVEDP